MKFPKSVAKFPLKRLTFESKIPYTDKMTITLHAFVVPEL